MKTIEEIIAMFGGVDDTASRLLPPERRTRLSRDKLLLHGLRCRARPSSWRWASWVSGCPAAAPPPFGAAAGSRGVLGLSGGPHLR